MVASLTVRLGTSTQTHSNRAGAAVSAILQSNIEMAYIENTEIGFASSLNSATVPRWQRKAMTAINNPPSPHADRFIPNRSSTSIEEGHYHLTACEEEEVGTASPSKLDYQRAMASSLFPENGSRVLAFSQAAPKPREGYQGDMPVLYSQPRTSMRRVARHIPQNPDRILDAPDLRGDFYLNTLDWSSSNVIAVALGQVARVL